MKILDYFKKNILNKEKIWFKILLFLLLFIAFFAIKYYNSSVSLDEIWNYGFAYNISRGLVPYLDYNMIVTPLYSFLLAIPLFIFGHHFLISTFFCSLLSAAILYLLIRKYGFNTLILFPCLSFVSYTGYNYLSLLLLVVILNINESKKSEYLGGFFVALSLLTKQTIGGVIFFYSFFSSKNKKQYLCGFLPPCILFIVYLLLNNSLYRFFDYCLFGMLDFTSENSLPVLDKSLVLYLIVFSLLIFMNIKWKFKNKDLIYILLFQVMAAPIFDSIHLLISVIPFLAYILFQKNHCDFKGFVSLFIILSYIISSTIIEISPFFDNSIIYHNDNSFLNGKRINFDLAQTHDVMNTIDTEFSGYKVYYLYSLSYVDKMEYNRTLNKYDLINDGNMGYHGEEKYIKEMESDCNKQKCLFILGRNLSKGSQISLKIYNYVQNNYKFNQHMHYVDFYTN